MDNLTTAMARAADTLSESLAAPRAAGSQTRYGTVVANNGSTLDVAMAGGTIAGVPMTTACCSAVAGDRVLLDVTGPLVTATGILANADNGPYVKFLYGSATTADVPGYCLYAVNGNLVTVMFAWASNSATDGVLGTLPAGIRPLNRAVGVAVVMGLAATGQLTVNEDGRIMINSSTKSNYWAGSITFQVAG